MKAFRSTAILLLIAAVLGAYIYWNERGPAVAPGSTVLARSEPDQVASIRLKQSDGQTLMLQKTGAAWSVQRGAGPAAPADSDQVRQLLDQLQLVQSSELASNDPKKLKEYGLDKPRSTLTAGDVTIEFGKKLNFDPSKIYARVGDKVALLPAAWGDVAARPLDAWRDKAVLRVAAEDVKELQIKAPAITATFEKIEATDDTGKSWKITTPVQAMADLGVMDSFLYTVLMTRAAATEGSTRAAPSGGVKTTRFLADNPTSLAPWGLDKPTAMVRVTTADGSQSLLIGKKVKDGYAAKNSTAPAVFVITEMPFGLINRPLRDWRSKSVLNLDINDLTMVEIAARNAVRSFKKENDKWQPAAGSTPAIPNAVVPEPAAVNGAVLEALVAAQGLNAVDFIDQPGPPATYGLDKPALSVAGLEIGTKNGKVYARAATGSTQNATVYVLPADTLSKFKRPLDMLFPPPKPGAPKRSPKGNEK
ncbi:MAG TPA: DUF4340 domain-containing protein [Abditibacteriaceae bacterium]|nr:DUF4340 domain-containing protein [Abditibacteriaceae bacterium]